MQANRGRVSHYSHYSQELSGSSVLDPRHFLAGSPGSWAKPQSASKCNCCASELRPVEAPPVAITALNYMAAGGAALLCVLAQTFALRAPRGQVPQGLRPPVPEVATTTQTRVWLTWPETRKSWSLWLPATFTLAIQLSHGDSIHRSAESTYSQQL